MFYSFIYKILEQLKAKATIMARQFTNANTQTHKIELFKTNIKYAYNK